jgi:hypothetical protein
MATFSERFSFVVDARNARRDAAAGDHPSSTVGGRTAGAC